MVIITVIDEHNDGPSISMFVVSDAILRWYKVIASGVMCLCVSLFCLSMK